MSVRKDTRVLDALIRSTPGQVDALVRGAAQEMTNEIVESFGASPSPPGDPPGVDTGALRASMRWASVGEASAVIHDGVEYGVHLELGTERMPARPFVAPVFERWRRGAFAQFARDFGILR